MTAPDDQMRLQFVGHHADCLHTHNQREGERFGGETPEKNPRSHKTKTSISDLVMTGCAVRLLFIPDRAGAFLRSGDNLGHIYLGGRASPGKRF